MDITDLATKLGLVIDKLTNREEYGIANELIYIKLALIEERSKEWNEGFNTGYGLALRSNELREVKMDQ